MFIFKKLFLITFYLCSASCSTLFYHPINGQIYSPEKMGLTHKEKKITTSDGEKLNAWYFEAQNPRGLILFFHGNAENISTHFSSLGWVVEQGYSFLIFDYRGYWKSTGKTTQEGTILDGKAVLNWGNQESKALKVPLIVFGQSLGGAVALRSVAEVSSSFRPELVIVESTFASYKSAAVSVLSRSWITWPLQWLPYLVIGDTWAPKGHLKKISPTPLVIMHGNKDNIVNHKLGQYIYKMADAPKEFWHVESGGHINSFWLQNGKWRHKFLEKLNSVTKK